MWIVGFGVLVCSVLCITLVYGFSLNVWLIGCVAYYLGFKLLYCWMLLCLFWYWINYDVCLLFWIAVFDFVDFILLRCTLVLLIWFGVVIDLVFFVLCSCWFVDFGLLIVCLDVDLVRGCFALIVLCSFRFLCF